MFFKKNEITQKNKISVSYLTGIFVLLLLYAWLDDFCRFINSSLCNGMVTNPVFCLIAAAVLLFVFILIIRNKISFYKINFNFIDLIVLSIGGVYFLLQLPFMDNNFDTIYYELIAQNHAFVNHVNSNDMFFIEKNFYYTLGDRIYYYLRMLLGFRLSLLYNLLTYILSYYLIKEILYCFSESLGFDFRNKTKSITIKGSIIPIVSIMIVLVEYFIVGMYIIKNDLLIVPILLECIRIIFFKKKLNTSYFMYISVLMGLSIVVKLTNIFFIIPLFVMLVFLHRKDFNFKKLLVLLFPGILILSIFVIYTWNATGNPFYPYYNFIFKSPYVAAGAATWDPRWGPSNTFETIFWPLFNAIKPGYRYSELVRCSGRLAIGYLVAIGVLISSAFSKQLRKLAPLALTFITMVLIWSITAGYCRYAIGIEVVAGLFIVMTLLMFYKMYKQKAQKRFKLGFIIIAFFFTLQFCYAQIIVTYLNLNWKNNTPTIFAYDAQANRRPFLTEYKKNVALLFTDRGNPVGENAQEIKDELKKVKAWICGYNSLYPLLIKPDVPVYEDNLYFDDTQKQQPLYNLQEKYGDGLYAFAYPITPIDPDNLQLFLQKNHFEIVKTFTFNVDFLPSDQAVVMYKVVPEYQSIIEKTPPVMENNTISLTPGRSMQLFDYINVGLSSQDDDGIWTIGTVVKMPMLLSSVAEHNTLQLTASAFENKSVVISLNSQEIGTYNFTEETETVDVPFEKSQLLNGNRIELELSIPDATVSPNDLGQSEDVGRLGLKLYNIKIIPN